MSPSLPSGIKRIFPGCGSPLNVPHSKISCAWTSNMVDKTSPRLTSVAEGCFSFLPKNRRNGERLYANRIGSSINSNLARIIAFAFLVARVVSSTSFLFSFFKDASLSVASSRSRPPLSFQSPSKTSRTTLSLQVQAALPQSLP